MSSPSEHHLGEDLAAMAAGGEELSSERRLELEKHVADCAACRRAIAESRLIFEALQLAPAVSPSTSFDRSLNARLDAIDREAQDSLWSRIVAWMTPPRTALAMVTAAVLVLVAISRVPEPVIAPQELAAELDPEAIELAENLELLQDFDVVDNLDVIDDLDLLAQVDEEEPG